MRELRRLAVFCGSSTGTDPRNAAVASGLGSTMARHGIGLVYGGGSVGLMGIIADAVQSGGGEVIGVITEALLELEVAHLGLGDLRVVATMHERKALMADLADGFVMIPGGFGTLDEFFEVVTWSQLGIHDKPCGVLDPTGYFEDLFTFLDRAVEAGFVTPANRALVRRSPDPVDLLRALRESWPEVGLAGLTPDDR